MSKADLEYTGDEDFDELLSKCFRIMKTKAVDYAEEGDRLAEIRETAGEMNITMRQALGVYMNKHLRSVKKWMRGEELMGEPVEEKLLDLIVYSLIGYKLCKEERKKKEAACDILATIVSYYCVDCGKEINTARPPDDMSEEDFVHKLSNEGIICENCLLAELEEDE